MKVTKLLFISFFTFLTSQAFPQESIKHQNLFASLNFHSKVLQEEQIITIHLPPSYQSNQTQNYPVMYVLDGQEYFLHPIAYQNMLRFKDKSPDFIVIGINSDRRKRRRFYYRDAAKFSNFLSTELIPMIDQKYRTLKEKERIYFGWEMAAGLAIDLFTQQPETFSAFFLASPTHITEQRLSDMTAMLKSKKNTQCYFHFAYAPEETGVATISHTVDKVIKESNQKNIRITIEELIGEDHYTTASKTIHNGLKAYFNDYKPLRYFSLNAYDKFGDLEAIKKYYQLRGKRYNISPEVQRATKHFLLLNSMKENRFDRFELYAQEFSDYLIGGLRLPHWVDRFAQNYLDNNQPKKAMKIISAGLKQFPDAAIVHKVLGNTYYMQGKEKKAKEAYQKALELAEADNDPNIEEYRKSLQLFEEHK